MDIAKEIDDFLAETGMPATTFGTITRNDPAFVSRVRAGRDIKVSTLEDIRSFMADERKRRKETA